MSEIHTVQRVAAKAIIEAEGGILALKPSKIDANQKWHIPGGLRDDIGENLEATAVREVMEETGIDLSLTIGRVCKIGEWNAVDHGEKVRILAVFFHYKLDARPTIELSHEHDDSAWLEPHNYMSYEANPEVLEIVEEILC